MENILTPNEKERYKRNILMPEIGEKGQAILKNTSVLVIGAGGLGSACIKNLAMAGIGKIGIMDFDKVDISNLQRQCLYEEKDVGKLKALVASQRVTEINKNIDVTFYAEKLKETNAFERFKDYDIIVDACDNFKARLAISDCCIKLKKPDIYGAVTGFQGQVAILCVDNAPCLRCLFGNDEKDDYSNQNDGVICSAVSIIGALQAVEVIKYAVKNENNLKSKMFFIDILNMNSDIISLSKNPKCCFCGTNN